MIPIIPLVCVAYFILYAFARSIPVPQRTAQILLSGAYHELAADFGPQLSLDAWIERQEKQSLANLLDNVAPGGKNTKNAAPGTVIASPSQSHPDYYSQWIRDAGITLSTLVNFYQQNSSSVLSTSTIVPILESYAKLSTKIQQTPNPSGDFSDLSGLGEPKFMVDGTPFTGNWGRPQRDGPALRALTLMAYLRTYNASHPALWTSSGADNNPFADLYDGALPAHSVVKADLEYVAKYWSAPGFDLWEEVQGLHFFTAMVQLRALREGAHLASAFNDPGAARWYHAQADALSELTQTFWSNEKGHLVETLDSSRSGLDCGLLLGAIHGSNEEDVSASPFPPYSDEVLSSLLALVKDQRYRFPVNAVPTPPSTDDFDKLAGTGVGRYPEDIYDGYGTSPAGGNPWFLCTSSVSEILFRTSTHLQQTRSLKFGLRGVAFWQALLPKMDVQADREYGADSEEFKAALQRLKSAGDSFLAVVRTHTSGDGSMSEQFDRVTGFERGATHLTWSYGAFLQAIEARKRA
ncbi:glucan-alpha-1,4-glucosidase-like protein [Microthyrium microscopicum]|uniref:glucan 1,4-alpha-glucosidase n=1 Tax=Microthyrium microscopicum TaxID=703497 RepID=A0A6A6UJ83_9PEZI|nr:glucan-alpha-1,4-glucosidase-like protein [Microthyrium microscopicum]